MKCFSLFAILLLTSCQSGDLNFTSLKKLLSAQTTQPSIAQGLKEALAKGTKKAVTELSQKGGYSKNLSYRVTVPDKLKKVTSTMRKMGFGSFINQFENKMNEAAELAVQQAAPVFLNAISSMTLDDAKQILMGNDTAATSYFQGKTSTILKEKYLPLIKEKMGEIGLVDEFNQLLAGYNEIPFISKVNFSLENYVTDKALKGLFDMVAKTEKDIRQNPLSRTSDLLKMVFAQQD